MPSQIKTTSLSTHEPGGQKKAMLRIEFSKVMGNMGHGIDYGMNAMSLTEELGGFTKDFVQGRTTT